MSFHANGNFVITSRNASPEYKDIVDDFVLKIGAVKKTAQTILSAISKYPSTILMAQAENALGNVKDDTLLIHVEALSELIGEKVAIVVEAENTGMFGRYRRPAGGYPALTNPRMSDMPRVGGDEVVNCNVRAVIGAHTNNLFLGIPAEGGGKKFELATLNVYNRRPESGEMVEDTCTLSSCAENAWYLIDNYEHIKDNRVLDVFPVRAEVLKSDNAVEWAYKMMAEDNIYSHIFDVILRNHPMKSEDGTYEWHDKREMPIYINFDHVLISDIMPFMGVYVHAGSDTKHSYLVREGVANEEELSYGSRVVVVSECCEIKMGSRTHVASSATYADLIGENFDQLASALEYHSSFGLTSAPAAMSGYYRNPSDEFVEVNILITEEDVENHGDIDNAVVEIRKNSILVGTSSMMNGGDSAFSRHVCKNEFQQEKVILKIDTNLINLELSGEENASAIIDLLRERCDTFSDICRSARNKLIVCDIDADNHLVVTCRERHIDGMNERRYGSFNIVLNDARLVGMPEIQSLALQRVDNEMLRSAEPIIDDAKYDFAIAD